MARPYRGWVWGGHCLGDIRWGATGFAAVLGNDSAITLLAKQIALHSKRHRNGCNLRALIAPAHQKPRSEVSRRSKVFA